METEILELASSPEGISLDEIMDMFGEEGFDIVDELAAEQLVWLDDAEGIVYATGNNPSAGLETAMGNYLGENTIRVTERQLKTIIKRTIKEYAQYGGVDWDRVEQYEKTLIKKFMEEKGREPSEEEAKKLSKRAYEDVAGGV